MLKHNTEGFTPPNPSFLHLLTPKWLTARARARGDANAKGRGVRLFILGFIGLIFWGLIFGVTFRLLRYFKDIPEIGVLLAGKLLGMILVGYFSLLLLSNVITSMSTFFLAKDLDLLVSAPVDWLKLYGAKLLETTLHSSWMVVLMAFPIFTAYGVVYNGGWQYVFIVLAAFVPFLMIPAVIGSAITLLLVNIFPARRTRDIMSVVAVMAAGGLVLLFRLIRPEQLARPEGFRSLVEFVSLLKTPTSPFLPNEWVQVAIMRWLNYEADVLPFYLLWSTAAAFIVLGALLHRSLYSKGFSKSQESSERWVREGFFRKLGNKLLTPFGTLRRELVLKEIRLFFRDTTQWSQLILLAVLIVVYVFNIKYLPLRGEGITFFLVNIVPFLNLALAGFVLASIAARFIFPGVSLEGRTLWLLRSSPMAVRDLLWAKFWVGTLPLLVLAVAIIFTTGVLLQVSEFMMAVSIGTITLMTFALAGLAIGFGTMFPQFDTENVAQIPTSFGGLLYMMSAVALIGIIIVLEARPVYSYLSARAFGYQSGYMADPTEMILGFGGAGVVCLVVTFFPIRIAINRLGMRE